MPVDFDSLIDRVAARRLGDGSRRGDDRMRRESASKAIPAEIADKPRRVMSLDEFARVDAMRSARVQGSGPALPAMSGSVAISRPTDGADMPGQVASVQGMALVHPWARPFCGTSKDTMIILTFGRQSGTLMVDNVDHPLSPRSQNTVTILPPGHRFRLTYQTQGDALCLAVRELPEIDGLGDAGLGSVPSHDARADGGMANALDCTDRLDRSEPVILQQNHNMIEAARFARRWLLSRRLGGAVYAGCLVRIIACHAADMLANPSRDTIGLRRRLCDRQVKSLKTFVDTHLDDDIPVSTLAATVGLSTSHFARAFKDATGDTPHHYIIKVRVERAKMLLRETDASLSEVAYTVGFSSQAHMTDTFRRIAGVTPGRYRRGNTVEAADRPDTRD